GHRITAARAASICEARVASIDQRFDGSSFFLFSTLDSILGSMSIIVSETFEPSVASARLDRSLLPESSNRSGSRMRPPTSRYRSSLSVRLRYLAPQLLRDRLSQYGRPCARPHPCSGW